MKFIIHYNGRYDDFVTIDCDTIEEGRETAMKEVEKRGWELDHVWSEEVK